MRCLFPADIQAVCKVIKAGGSLKLMHLPRTHCIDAAAVSEQFSRGIVELQHERARGEAADIGAKRFTCLLAWVEVSYLVKVVTPKSWAAKRFQDYLDSMFSDGRTSLGTRGDFEAPLRPELGAAERSWCT
eukprot:5494456-Pyramimonas_sp.AAC.1